MTRPFRRPAFVLALRRLLLGAAVPLLGACAATGPDHDPYESFNRGVYAFNNAVDEAALKPAATLYAATAPRLLSEAITNFFGNLRDIQSVLNDSLQGKGASAARGMLRVTVNSTLGLAGLMDVGTDMGLEKRSEDFGQTLGVWGMDSGPYLVLPLLGPSSGRDALGTGVDIFTDPLTHFGARKWRYAAGGLRLVDDRAGVLEYERILEAAAMDEYRYVRDAYLQRRQGQVEDSDPHMTDEEAFSEE